MLLSYLATLRPAIKGCLQGITMVEKNMKIDWSHIAVANSELGDPVVSLPSGLPIDLKAGVNIHTEELEESFRGLPGPVAMVGIHLCRGLSPRCIGLFNMLGPKAPFLALAPCCVPQAHVKTIEVHIYETPEERTRRIDSNARRARVVHSACRYCGKEDHAVKVCPSLPSGLSEEVRQEKIRQAILEAPCWRCGQKGHQKADCTAPQAAGRPPRVIKPMLHLDMSEVRAGRRPLLQGVQDASNDWGLAPTQEGNLLPPFEAWVHTLHDVVEVPPAAKKVTVVPLAGRGGGCHDERDWAGYRKCSWLVASRQ